MNLSSRDSLLLAAIFSVSPIYAQTDAPDAHAPIGVMADYLHEAGEFMFSYRYMKMRMEDSLIGSDSISPEQIVSTVPNRFSNPPMMSPTLRVLPKRVGIEGIGVGHSS